MVKVLVETLESYRISRRCHNPEDCYRIHIAVKSPSLALMKLKLYTSFCTVAKHGFLL